MAQTVRYILCNHDDLDLSLDPQDLCRNRAHVSNSSTWEEEMGRVPQFTGQLLWSITDRDTESEI